jgi:hypothetical protein
MAEIGVFHWDPAGRILSADASDLGVEPGQVLKRIDVAGKRGDIQTFELSYEETGDNEHEVIGWIYKPVFEGVNVQIHLFND